MINCLWIIMEIWTYNTMLWQENKYNSYILESYKMTRYRALFLMIFHLVSHKWHCYFPECYCLYISYTSARKLDIIVLLIIDRLIHNWCYFHLVKCMLPFNRLCKNKPGWLLRMFIVLLIPTGLVYLFFTFTLGENTIQPA